MPFEYSRRRSSQAVVVVAGAVGGCGTGVGVGSAGHQESWTSRRRWKTSRELDGLWKTSFKCDQS